jgi:hypothetical protein
VARAANGAILAYFFPGSVEHDLTEALSGEAGDAHLVAIVSDMGLRTGRWKVLGRHLSWDRESWPMPPFGRHDEVMDIYHAVEYPDSDPSAQGIEKPISKEEWGNLPVDGAWGDLAVEAALHDLLTENSVVDSRAVTSEGEMSRSGGPVKTSTTFYLYFAQQDAALAAEARLGAAGPSRQVASSRSAQGFSWVVRLRSTLSSEEIVSTEAELREVARELGGEYDGFERDTDSVS